MRNNDLMSQAGQFIVENKNEILDTLLNDEHNSQIYGLLGNLILLIGDRISFGDQAVTQIDVKNYGYDIHCTNHSQKTSLEFVNLLPSVSLTIWDYIKLKDLEHVLEPEYKLILNQEIESTILNFNAGYLSAIVEDRLIT